MRNNELLEDVYWWVNLFDDIDDLCIDVPFEDVWFEDVLCK
jgi:hypothetical protein